MYICISGGANIGEGGLKTYGKNVKDGFVVSMRTSDVTHLYLKRSFFPALFNIKNTDINDFFFEL